jgi:hypothetical protein
VTVSDSPDRGFEDELAAALSDPRPPEVRNTVEELLTWRAVDADLAELLRLETLDPLSSGVRHAGTVMTLSYPEGSVSVDLEIDSGARVLRGQVSPEQHVDVRLVRRGGSQERVTRSSPMGTFVFDRVLAGPAQLVVVTSNGATVKTPWFIT